MCRLAHLFLLVACGPSAKTAGPVGNTTTAAGPTLAMKPGVYPCGFYANDIWFGPYKCIVKGNTIEKLRSADGGGTAFTGTLSAAGAGVHLEGKLDCQIKEVCNFPFTVDLTADNEGTFKGKVKTASEPNPDYGWFLVNAELHVQRGGYGGDQYGSMTSGDAMP